jgi:RsiW-degrading membrane proteinase PrsW (M82 family)
MNFGSLLVIYLLDRPSVATISRITRYAVAGAFITLFISANFASFINQSVIVSMLLYSFPEIESRDFDSFIIKSIATDFQGSCNCGIDYINL